MPASTQVTLEGFNKAQVCNVTLDPHQMALALSTVSRYDDAPASTKATLEGFNEAPD